MNSAFTNLRALIILFVVAVHATAAYVSGVDAASSWGDFDKWRIIPILDKHSGFVPFDLFCAWQNLYLMPLSFFLSGLFVWRSLTTKQPAAFIKDRLIKLGVPFIFGVLILMPIAYYPAFAALGGTGYLRSWFELPFWPNGPLWFLWELLFFDLIAVVCYQLFQAQAVAARERLSQMSMFSVTLLLVGLSVVAYVPLTAVVGPWQWSDGIFNFQLCRPLLYATYFAVGVGIGPSGRFFNGLGEKWLRSSVVTGALLCCWLAFTLWSFHSASVFVHSSADLLFALGCVAGCLSMMALCFKFLDRTFGVMAAIGRNSYGIYLLHFPFVVWLQYALLDVEASVIMKAAIVFCGALGGSWLSLTACRVFSRSISARVAWAAR